MGNLTSMAFSLIGNQSQHVMTATGQWLSVSREISIQIYQGQTQVKGYESLTCVKGISGNQCLHITRAATSKWLSISMDTCVHL